MGETDSSDRCRQMVDRQIVGRGVADPRVIEAMRRVPREAFVPPEQAEAAYEDRPLPVGLGQTISQPYIVAYMSEALKIEPSHRVLEVGTGTGYQTAVLARLAAHVYTIERLPELSAIARERLASLNCTNVSFRVGDGSVGWPDESPFDRIMVTAAGPHIPQALVDQLRVGGLLLLPVGENTSQHLTLVERHPHKIVEKPLIAVRFVRLYGDAAFTA